MSKSKRRSGHVARRMRFESLEDRIVLDSQIGTVIMPYAGTLSAKVYDASGSVVATLHDQSGEMLNARQESAGAVSLFWDGKNDAGVTITPGGTYTWKAVTSQATLVNEGGIGDSLFTGTPTPTVGSYSTLSEINETVMGVGVNTEGGTLSGVGGTFARAQVDAYYGDTFLTEDGTTQKTYTLNDTVSASGKFDVYDITPGWDRNDDGSFGNSGFFIGHFSSSQATSPVLRHEFVGLQIGNGGEVGTGLDTVDVRAEIIGQNGWSNDGAWIPLSISGQHTFSYTFYPHQGVDGLGRLVVNIDNLAPLISDITTAFPTSAAQWDSFGMGYVNVENTATVSTDTVKAILDDVTYTGNPGMVDFNSAPPSDWQGDPQHNNTSYGNNFGWKQVNMADGGLYVVSAQDEGFDTTKFNADGSFAWANGSPGFMTAVTADDRYAYVTFRDADNRTYVNRVSARDGAEAPFPAGSNVSLSGYLIVNGAIHDTRAPGQGVDSQQSDRARSNWGIAVDGSRIFVSNNWLGKIEVFNKSTGAKIGELSGIQSPMGIALQVTNSTSGVLWVANDGEHVSRYTYSTSGGTITFSAEDASRRISGLNDPGGLSIGGPNGHLFLGEIGAGQVREYDISSTPTLAGVQILGSKHDSGPITANQFNFAFNLNQPIVTASVAVDQNGILSVVDPRRIQRFYTTTGSGHTVGDLYQSWVGQWGGAPTDTYGYASDGTYYVLDSGLEYQVDPNYSSGPRAGWLGDGSWRLAGRYYNGANFRRTLMDGGTPREFLFSLENSQGIAEQTITAYAIEPTGLRRSAIVGTQWRGVDGLGTLQGGAYSWTDTDKDGQIDWNGAATGTAGEVVWKSGAGLGTFPGQYTNPWVDDSGNIWFIDGSGKIVEVPLTGFDANHNPVYNWNNLAIKVTLQDDAFDFTPVSIHVASNGDIYALGLTNYAIAHDGSLGIGADWVAIYDSSGTRKLLAPIPEYDPLDTNPNLSQRRSPRAASITYNETDPNSDYFFLGGETALYMYNKDGLLVANVDTSGGWIDITNGLTAFTQPFTGQTYVLAEDNYFGRDIRYHVQNLDTVRQFSGTIQWSVPADPSSQSLPAVTVAATDNTATEASGNTGVFTISRVGTSGNLVVNYAVGGSATSGADFSALAGSITIVSGQSSTTVTVTPIQDTLVEGNETVQLSIVSGTSYLLGATTTDAVTITDDDTTNPTITLSVTDGSAAETSSNTGTIQINRSNTTGALTVFYTLSTSTALNDLDYSKLSGSIVIPNGLSSATVTITPIDDALVESSENVVLQIASNPLYTVGSPSSGTVTITDNDTATTTVTVVASDASASEQGQGKGVFTFTRNNTGSALTVTYTVGGTATGTSNADYTALSGSVNIPSGASSAQVTVTPIDDSLSEGSETVLVTLNSGSYTIGTPAGATVTIADNEPTVIVSATDPIATELGLNPGVFTFRRDNSVGSLTVGYTVSTGSGMATSGSDYSTLAGSVTFADGQASVQVAVAPIDDQTTEGDEQVVVTINTNSAYTVGAANSAVVTLRDNDQLPTLSGRWTFDNTLNDSAGTNNGTYPVGTASYVTGLIGNAINLSGASDYVNIPYTTTLTAYTISIWVKTPSDVSTASNVLIRTDGVYGPIFSASEQIEINGGHFLYYLSDAGLGGKVVIGTTSVQPNTWYHVAIQAANSGMMRLYVNGVEEGTAKYVAQLWGGGDRFHIGDAAFNALPTQAQPTLANFNGTVDDLRIFNQTLSPQDIQALYSTGIPIIAISATDPIASEQGPDLGVFTFTRFGNTNGAVVVNYTTNSGQPGAATNGTDYTPSLTGSVTIASGSSSATITITPVSDSLSEGNETVELSLIKAAGYNIFSDSATTARITIADNGVLLPVVTVIADDQYATEAGTTTGSYTFTRDNTSGSLVVNYTMGGTATSGSDYTALPGSLTIPNGQSSVTITLTPIDDAAAEADESATLTISSSANYSVGVLASASITIYDNEPPPVVVGLVVSDSSAAELSSNTGTFNFQRNGTSGNLVVNYTIGGTATNGVDYTTLPGQATITAGQSSVNVTVTPIQDSVYEGNETVTLTITTSANYLIGVNGNGTVTIADDDTATPVGKWQFDNNVNDSASTNNGTFNGGIAVYNNGQINQALDLDGVDDYVNIPYSTNFTAYTISAWVKPTDVTSVNIVVRTDSQGPTVSPSDQIRINSTGKFEHSLYDSSSGSLKAVTGTTTAQSNTWYHVAIVASNSGMMRLYVNGVEEGTAQSVGTIWQAGDRFHVGDAAYAGMGFFDGLVDDLRFYDQALSAASIQAIYNDVPPTIAVTATDANAAEPGTDTGVYTFTRTSTSGSLVVNYTMSGTATSGSDYSVLASSVTFASGSATATVTLTPMDDALAESSETAILTIASGSNYVIGMANSATVNIADDEPTVTVSATDSSASEPGTDKGVYTFTRNTTSGALVVNYTMSGTATSGSDYTALPGSVTIASGQTSATVTLTPKDDATAEADETVVLTISSSTGYNIGTPNSAVVTIADNEIVSPIGKWQFDNNVNDSTGAHNGTFNGGTAAYANGQINQALDLDGIDDYVNIPYSTNFTAYTIMAWVKPTDVTSVNIVVRTDSQGPTVSPSDQIRINSTGKFEHSLYDSSSGSLKAVTGTTTAQSNTWYQVAIVASNSGMMRLYVNGVEEGTAQSVGTIWQAGDRFHVGDAAYAGMGFFDGLVDDLRFYDQALSASNILALYNETPPIVTITATDPNAAEPSDTGIYTVTRNNTNGSLVVNYTASGTATSGTDYTALPGSVTIASGQSSATITVIPIDDVLSEGSETVTLTIASNANYSLGTASSAIVTIADNEAPLIASEWQFENNVNDSVGTNNGTFNGGTAAYATGKIGQAINLDGVDDYVNIPYATNPTSYTITAWVKPTTLTNVNVFVRTDSQGPTVSPSDQIRINSAGHFEHSVYDSSVGALKAVTGTTTVQANTWYQVAIVASNGGMMRLYVNGVEEGTAQTIGALWPYGDRFHLGDAAYGGFDFFKGLVDDVRIYQQALNPTDIQAIYANVPYTARLAFDNNVNDSTGTYNGTFNGGTAAYANGQVNQAIDLDGVDDYVNIPYSPDFTAYTIMAWVKPTDVTSVNIVVRTDSQGPTVSPSDQIRINSTGKFEHSLYDSSSGSLKAVTGTTTAQSNTWYHVAIVASNSGMMRLYVNGVEEGTAQSVGTIWQAGDRFHVGDAAYAGMGFFDGLVDDLRFYDQALSATDITAISHSAAFAGDGFESGTGSGGFGWLGAWSLTGSASVTSSGTPNSGAYQLQLTSNNGVASRAVDLTGVTSAYLIFDWKANSFEAGETAVVEIYNGSSWVSVLTVSDGQDDNAFHHANISLASYSLTSSFQVRIRSQMSAADDFFYVDDLQIGR